MYTKANLEGSGNLLSMSRQTLRPFPKTYSELQHARANASGPGMCHRAGKWHSIYWREPDAKFQRLSRALGRYRLNTPNQRLKSFIPISFRLITCSYSICEGASEAPHGAFRQRFHACKPRKPKPKRSDSGPSRETSRAQPWASFSLCKASKSFQK